MEPQVFVTENPVRLDIMCRLLCRNLALENLIAYKVVEQARRLMELRLSKTDQAAR